MTSTDSSAARTITRSPRTPRSSEKRTIRPSYGSELFPFLMFLILALVTAENLLANKFHRETAAA